MCPVVCVSPNKGGCHETAWINDRHDRCIGCKTCVVACRNHHKIVDHETCMPEEIPYYIRVETKCSGTYRKQNREMSNGGSLRVTSLATSKKDLQY